MPATGTLATLGIGIQVPLEALRAGLSKARGLVAGTAASMGKSLRLAMAVAGGNILAGGIAGIADKMRDMVAEGIAFNAQMETMEIGFTNMLKSADKARKLVADIKKFAKTTPFSIDDTSTLASQLLTTRQIAEDQLIPTMRKLGDAAAGSAKGFKSLPGISLAITQMLMKGKISAEEMSRQLVNAGIPAWDILAQKTGKTTKELMALAKEGKLGLNAVLMLIDGMGERFDGLMENQSRSWTGLMERFKDSFRQALGEITGPLFNRLKRMLVEINKFMDSAKFKQIVSMLRSLMESAITLADKGFAKLSEGVASAITQVKFYMENWRMVFDYIVARSTYVASWLFDQFAYTIDVRLPYAISALWDGMIAGGREFINQFQVMVGALINFMAAGLDAIFAAWKVRLQFAMTAFEMWKNGFKPSEVLGMVAAGEAVAQGKMLSGMKTAGENFAGQAGGSFASIGQKIGDAVRAALTGMPGFSTSRQTDQAGFAAAVAADTLEMGKRRAMARESARSKIRSGIDFLADGAGKGMDFIGKLFAGKAKPLGIGPLVEDEKKKKKAEFVGLGDLNRRIQESLTSAEAKDRKKLVKAAEKGAAAGEKGAAAGEKVVAAVGFLTGVVKKLAPGFGP